MQQVGSADSLGLTSTGVTFEDETPADLFNCQVYWGRQANVLPKGMLAFFLAT